MFMTIQDIARALEGMPDTTFSMRFYKGKWHVKLVGPVSRGISAINLLHVLNELFNA